MKALLAVGNEHVSKNIADRYFEKFGETLEYKTVFYYKSIVDTIREDKSYNVIVIQEESMEQYKAKTIEQIDSEIFGYFDTITDEIQDTEIIYIGAERRTREDPFVLRLFNLGVYNILLGDDRSLNILCDVIKKPRNKRDAKEYLKIDSNSLKDTGNIRDDEVDEAQMMNILNYYDRYREEPEKWVEIFDNIASQYNRAQLKIIFSWLRPDVQAVVLEEPKYKFLMSGINTTVKPKQESSWNQNAKKIEKKLSKDFFGVFRGKKKGEETTNITSTPIQQEKTNDVGVIKKVDNDSNSQIKQELSNKAWQEVEERSQKLRQQEEELKKQQEQAEQEFRKQQEQAEQELRQRALQEQAKREQEQNQINLEQQLKQQAMQEQAKREQELREQALQEQAKREQELREQALQEQAKREQELREQALQEQAKREQELREQALQEQAKREQEQRQQQLQEQEKFEQELRQQQLQEKAKREQERNERINQTIDVEPVKIEPFNTAAQVVTTTTNVINSSEEVLDNRKLEEQKRMREEQERIKQEQDRIKRLQEELEEEKRKIYEEQSKLATEKTQPKEKDDLENRTYEATPVVPMDFKKVVAFVGANKAGTSFLVNAVAFELSKQRIITGILDMTKDKSMYYIYNQNDTSARRNAAECMKNLSEGEETFLKVSKYLKVYTAIPGGASDNRRGLKHKTIIETVKNSNNITIIDADFSTPIDYFEQASEIYLIQDMDILKIQDATLFLREMKSRNLDMNKIKIIVNKYIKSSLNPGRIIDGLSSYKDPEMTFIDKLLTNKVEHFVVPYDSNNYIRYIEAISKGTMNFKGYTQDFEEAIQKIASRVFVQGKKKKGLFG